MKIPSQNSQPIFLLKFKKNLISRIKREIRMLSEVISSNILLCMPTHATITNLSLKHCRGFSAVGNGKNSLW